jgi:exodeoxyribonuclease VII large subunit
VVRAIAASAVPVISGVGHETDFTLADFVADLRAPTPTAAAELGTPVTRAELGQSIELARKRLGGTMLRMILARRSEIESVAGELRYQSPARRIQSDRQLLDEIGRRMLAAQLHRLALQVKDLNGWRSRLQTLSPLEVLKRGYAVVTRQSDGVVVRQVAQARGEIRVHVSDGDFDAEVVRTGN